MDDRARSKEQVARLAADSVGRLYSVSGSGFALRSSHWSETRDHRGGNSGSDDRPSFDHHSQGGTQMSFRERFARELQKLYAELLDMPPLFVFVISCFALLLVGALLVAAK